MPYGMTDLQYAIEVDRKGKNNLTAPFDEAAYNRGKAQLQQQQQLSQPSSKSGTKTSSSSSSPSKSKSSSSSSSIQTRTSVPSNYIPIRETFEKLGYNVDYDSGVITLSDSIRSGTINPNAYYVVNGRA